jgi:hypothetical protein
MAQAKSRASGNKRSTDRSTAEQPTGPPPLCSVSFCPICLAVTTAAEVRPEFVGHLVSAGREFLLALRAVIDARLEELEPPVKLERLTIE